MPASYSQDLRQKSIAAYRNGEGSQRAIAKRFDIGLRTFQEWLALQNETGALLPRKHTSRGRQCIISGKRLEFIRAQVEKKPDIIIATLIALFMKKFKVRVSLSMVSRALGKLNLRRKKKSVYAQEQARDDVKKNDRNGKRQ